MIIFEHDACCTEHGFNWHRLPGLMTR